MRPSSSATLSDWLYSRNNSPSSMPESASPTMVSTRRGSMPVRSKNRSLVTARLLIRGSGLRGSRLLQRKYGRAVAIAEGGIGRRSGIVLFLGRRNRGSGLELDAILSVPRRHRGRPPGVAVVLHVAVVRARGRSGLHAASGDPPIDAARLERHLAAV